MTRCKNRAKEAGGYIPADESRSRSQPSSTSSVLGARPLAITEVEVGPTANTLHGVRAHDATYSRTTTSATTTAADDDAVVARSVADYSRNTRYTARGQLLTHRVDPRRGPPLGSSSAPLRAGRIASEDLSWSLNWRTVRRDYSAIDRCSPRRVQQIDNPSPWN